MANHQIRRYFEDEIQSIKDYITGGDAETAIPEADYDEAEYIAIGHYEADLNNDGLDDALVTFSAPGWGGSAGVAFYILFGNDKGSYSCVFYATMQPLAYGDDESELFVSSSKSNGSYDVVIKREQTVIATLFFNGTTYEIETWNPDYREPVVWNVQ